MDESFGNADPQGSLVATGQVSWFNPEKRFGFVKLKDGLGDAFLHVDVLEAGGYYFIPRGTTALVRVESDRGKQRVAELLHIDISTAQQGEPPPLSVSDSKKERAERRERHALEVEASQKALRESISETERLVDESDKMLGRHRKERDDHE